MLFQYENGLCIKIQCKLTEWQKQDCKKNLCPGWSVDNSEPLKVYKKWHKYVRLKLTSKASSALGVRDLLRFNSAYTKT